MFTSKCLGGCFVQFVSDLHGLQEAYLGLDIQIAVKPAELQVEIDQRHT